MPTATGTRESASVQRRSLRLTGPAALTIVGTVVGLVVLKQVFVAAHRPISWAVGAVAAAVLLDPIVDRFSRHIPRGPAVLLTFLAIGAIGVGTAYLVFGEVEEAVDRLKAEAPNAAAEIEDRDDRIGELARDFELSDRVQDAVGALDERVAGGEEVLVSTAGTAPAYLVSAILTIFLMTFGPRMATAAIEQDPDPERRRRTALVLGPAVAHARNAVLLNALEAIVVGTVVAAVATALDVTAPLAVGFAAGVLSLFPHVGLVLGCIPLLLLTLASHSVTVALLLAAVVGALQLADSFLLRPHIANQSVETGLLVPWVVALLGYTIYGIGGAVFGTIYAVFALAVLDQLDRENRRRTSSPL
jgi:predicted PurR-regulated permease PerM